MAGGVVWIGVVAVLLAGVVAVNVAVLRLNLRLDHASRERARLQGENAALASRLSSARSSMQIEQLARSRLGLVPAEESQTTYVRISRRAR